MLLTVVLSCGLSPVVQSAQAEAAKKAQLTVIERIKQQQNNQVKPAPGQETLMKNLSITVGKLTDSSGLVYLGGKITEAELAPYLSQLKYLLGDEYALFRHNQGQRDHFSFHMTLINPYEYQKLDASKLDLTQPLKVTLLGIGRVSVGDKTSYYVVANSPDGQFFRQKHLLAAKDFHVTLGFDPQDVYGVSKGEETLLKTKLKKGL